ncbi:MAG: hypothetical protein ACPG5N_09820, partial [Planktomarina sp.]
MEAVQTKIGSCANESYSRYSVRCVLVTAHVAPPAASGKVGGNYCFCDEISGFTFDGNLTTSNSKIRTNCEGPLTT